jgi:hypothetical protein
MLAREIAIQRIIGVTKKGLLAAVAALRDVVGQAREDSSGKTGHGRS